MTRLLESFAHWLADFYLLSAVLLAFSIVAIATLRQPAQRLAIVKSTLLALFLLAGLCALPGWSIVHLIRHEPSAITSATPREPVAVASHADVPDAEPLRTEPVQRLPSSSPVSSANAEAPITRMLPQMSWIAWLALAQLGGAVCVATWLALGWFAARRLRQKSRPAPQNLTMMLLEIAGPNHALAERVQLMMSDRIDVAVALGIRRPAILLPAKWITNFPLHHREACGEPRRAGPGEDSIPLPLPIREGLGEGSGSSSSHLRSVLAHELAHIRNHDLHWLALSRGLNVLLWAQPLYWFVRRRMRLDQEALADAAAAQLTSPQKYAEQLVAWARNVAAPPHVRLAAAVGLWEGPSQLRQRIALLVDERFTVLGCCSRRYGASAAIIATVAAIVLSMVSIEPRSRAEAQKTTPAADEIKESAAPPAIATNAGERSRPEPNIIAGSAVDEGGQPLAGAEVFLFRVNRYDSTRKLIAQKKTDFDGRFRFDDVIDIAKEFPNGKFPPLDEVGGEFLQVGLRAPARVSESWLELPQRVAQWGHFRALKLLSAATLRGRVTAPDGKPVARALVSVGGTSFDRWEGAKSDRTDVNGNYEINDVAPFQMQQYLEQQEDQRRKMEEQSRKGDEVYSVFISPPVLVIEHPDFAIKKTDFEEIPGTKDVQLESAAILEGRVVYGDSGKPAAGALVQVATSLSSNRLPVMDVVYSHHRAADRADADGKYRFTTLPGGAYDVWAESPGWVNEGANQIAATTEKTTTVPDLTLMKGVVVSVRLFDAKTGKPLELPPDARAMVGAHPLRLHPTSRPGFSQSVAANSDGEFEVAMLPGRNRIWVGSVTIGGEPKWFGTHSEEPREVTVAEGKTTSVDLPVVDAIEVQNTAAVRTTRLMHGAPLNLREKPREAIEALNRILREQPDDNHALLSRAEAWQALGEYGKAVADLERLIGLNPPGIKNVIAHNNLAYLLSTAPDESVRNGKRAVELAEKAQQLHPEPLPDLLDTLAAAYAEAGDFDKAIESQQKAIELKPDSESFRQHLKLYQANKPLRETRAATDRPANDNEHEEQGSQFLRDLRAKAAPLLASMATEHGYGLKLGKDLVRVAPPFAPIRMDYYRTAHPTQAEAIRRGPSAMVFRWDKDQLMNWGMTFGDSEKDGYNLTSILDALVDIKSQHITGPPDLLKTRLAGDWIIRPGVDKVRIIKQLQEILQDGLSLPVSMEFRKVKRRVYVVRGKYQLTPLPGYSGENKLILADETLTTDEIQIFGKQLVPNSGAGGGTGHFDEFLNWLGRWVGTAIVSNVDRLPSNQISWHLHEQSPSTEQTREEDHDPKLVLANIKAQTGLEFALDVHPIEILFVERSRPVDD